MSSTHPCRFANVYPNGTESKKSTATVESQNTNLIARANSSSRKRAMETASVSHDEEHQHAVISFADGAKVQQNSETTKDLAKKARPLNSKMANADTLEGAGVNSGNALDAAKLQNNSETTKDKEQKRTATVELQNTFRP